MSTLLLTLLIVVLAPAGVFLGELLEAALIVACALAAVGALIGDHLACDQEHLRLSTAPIL